MSTTARAIGHSIGALAQGLQIMRPSLDCTRLTDPNGVVTQPQYRVAVVSDLNGLFLVLTDRRAGAAR